MLRIPILFMILFLQHLVYSTIKNNYFVCKPTLIEIDHHDNNNDNDNNNHYHNHNNKNINMTSSHLHNTSLPYIFPFPKIFKSNSNHIDSNHKYKLSLYPKFYIHIIDNNIKHDNDKKSIDGYESNLDQIEKILDRYCIESTYFNYHNHYHHYYTSHQHKYNNNNDNNDIHSHHHHHHDEDAVQYYYIKNINIELTSRLSLIEINDVMTTLLFNDRNSRSGKNNNKDEHNHDKHNHRHHDHSNINQNLLINELYTLDINNNNNIHNNIHNNHNPNHNHTNDNNNNYNYNGHNNNNHNHNVTIRACGYRGIINAIMTLDQLLSASPPHSSTPTPSRKGLIHPSIVSLPLSIIDWPDNIWRG